MKKKYVKPIMDVFNVDTKLMCSSGSYWHEPSYEALRGLNDEDRMKYMIRYGENISPKHQIRQNDIFVYNKVKINHRIIKNTSSNPVIGSIIQLDDNTKVKIYKHLRDNGYNYWYCIDLPKNSTEYMITY